MRELRRTYAVSHRPFSYYAAGAFVVPFVIGQSDAVGDTLSGERQFSETRGHYWLWRNGKFSDDEFVGINQYRRCFWFSQLVPSGHRLSEISTQLAGSGQSTVTVPRDDYVEYINLINRADLAPLNRSLEGVDLVVNRDLQFGYPMSRLYAQNHWVADWEVFFAVCREHGYDPGSPTWLTTHTVYVFTPALFDEYMTDWWRVMSAVNERVPFEEHPYQHRKFGFMSEWFMTAWLLRLRPTVRVLRLPVIEGDFAEPRG